MKLIDLIPVVDTFLIGNADTQVIYPPEAVRQDHVICANVTSITAKDDIPVIWLDVKEV